MKLLGVVRRRVGGRRFYCKDCGHWVRVYSIDAFDEHQYRHRMTGLLGPEVGPEGGTA